MADPSLPSVSGDQPIDLEEARMRQRGLGKELRQWYDSIATEPVPDELLDLIDQLETRGPVP